MPQLQCDERKKLSRARRCLFRAFEEILHGALVKIPSREGATVKQDVAAKVPEVRPDPRVDRHREPSFLSFDDLLRDSTIESGLQDVLRREAMQLVAGRQAGSELEHLVIQQWHAKLD